MTPTSPVQAQTSPVPAGKQTNSAPADVPFNQVLSGEMANRQSSANTDKSSSQGTDSKTAQDQQTISSAGGHGVKETKSADTTDAKLKDSKDIKDDAATSPVSTDLLALVANLSHVSGKSNKVDGPQPEQEAGIAIGIGKGAGAAHASLQKSQIAAQLDGSTGNASLKPDIDLTAHGKQSGDLKLAIDPTAIKFEPNKLQDITLGATPAALAPLQQASANIAQAMAGMPGEKLTPSVGTPAWDQALGQKIVWMAAGAQQSASLTLNPPDLGPLQVVVHVNNDQASATFISAHPDVRHALEAALPKLREMMGDAGIQLGQSTVSAGNPNQQDSQGGSSRHATSGMGNMNAPIDNAIQTGHVQIRTTGLGMVDTFA
ncbi:MAG: flagellar hook-length control protein FliK [Pseudomonadota bacterium]